MLKKIDFLGFALAIFFLFGGLFTTAIGLFVLSLVSFLSKKHSHRFWSFLSYFLLTGLLSAFIFHQDLNEYSLGSLLLQLALISVVPGIIAMLFKFNGFAVSGAILTYLGILVYEAFQTMNIGTIYERYDIFSTSPSYTVLLLISIVVFSIVDFFAYLAFRRPSKTVNRGGSYYGGTGTPSSSPSGDGDGYSSYSSGGSSNYSHHTTDDEHDQQEDEENTNQVDDDDDDRPYNSNDFCKNCSFTYDLCDCFNCDKCGFDKDLCSCIK